jgi:4-amino-4-deoxy-L-arabinose transferase-like glycosyltransferase
LAAAALRLVGLGWGLDNPVHNDERVYVEPVIEMVRQGDLDHRFYTYPGLFFYLLAPGVAAAGAVPNAPGAYLAARLFVALCGVASVGLAYLAARAVIGRAAGLVAAWLVAVSPLTVHTAHQVRPDVLLEGLGFVFLWALARNNPPRDIRLGGLIGLATAIKFTGLLMVPAFVLSRLRGPRALRGLALAGCVTLAVVVACTPYALVHAARYQHGPGAQLDLYFQGHGVDWARLAQHIWFYAYHVGVAIGPAGCALAAWGVVLARRERWCWAGCLHLATVVLVMSAPLLAFGRLVMPATAVAYLLVGAGVQHLCRRRTILGVAMGALAVIPGLVLSSASAWRLTRPTAADQARAWLIVHTAPTARVLETRPDADPGVAPGAAIGGREVTRIDRGPHLAAEVCRYDVVVTAMREQPAWTAMLAPVLSARNEPLPMHLAQAPTFLGVRLHGLPQDLLPPIGNGLRLWVPRCAGGADTRALSPLGRAHPRP